MKKQISLAFWIFSIFIAFTGCGPGEAKIKVAFVSNNAAEFWTICEAGARKAAEESNVDLQFKRPQDGAAATQKQIIEDLLTNKAQAISVSVISPDNQIDFLDVLLPGSH